MVTFSDIIGFAPSAPGLYFNSIMSTLTLYNINLYNISSVRNFNSFWVLARSIEMVNTTCTLMNSYVQKSFMMSIFTQGGCGYFNPEHDFVMNNV